MKRLTIIRHAKAVPADDGHDFERTLSATGEHEAEKMGDRLARRGVRPQCVLTSAAPRARRTAEIVAAALGVAAETIRERRELYLAGPRELLEAVRALEPALDEVVLVAHNPGLTLLCNYLTPDRLDELPTAGVFQIEFEEGDWRQLDRESGRLRLFDYPARPE